LDVFSGYLGERAVVEQLLTGFYAQHTFQKLRLQSYAKEKQGDRPVAKNLRNKFCTFEEQGGAIDPIVVLGNWSATMTKFHEPNRGKGMRRMQGFNIS
jgi:hypothetical protein